MCQQAHLCYVRHRTIYPAEILARVAGWPVGEQPLVPAFELVDEARDALERAAVRRRVLQIQHALQLAQVVGF